MKNKRNYILIIILIFIILSVIYSFTRFTYDDYPEDFFEDIPFEMKPEDCLEGESYDIIEKICYIECDTEEECLKIEEEIIKKAETIGDPSFEDEEDFSEFLEEDIIILARYKINNGNLILIDKPILEDNELKNLQDDFEKHEKIWIRYKTLIPINYAPFLVEFHIATDGKEGTFGATEQNLDNLNNWNLIIDIKDAFIADDQFDDKELTYTLIHEFGHLLTLNSNQLESSEQIPEDLNDEEYEKIYNEKESKCPEYFTEEGCTKENSYLNLFFKTFWEDIHEELKEINSIEDDKEFNLANEEFYEKYSEQFVTDYASTNPEEDIAESWTSFILQEKPKGDTIAEKKILFFYNFKELLKLRDTIRTRL